MTLCPSCIERLIQIMRWNCERFDAFPIIKACAPRDHHLQSDAGANVACGSRAALRPLPGAAGSPQKAAAAVVGRGFCLRFGEDQ